jgi:flagellar biosynthesis protein FlhF
MRVKRYEAKDIQDALAQIKLDLGPDAVVLYVKEVKRYRSFRLNPTKTIEVIAGIEENQRDVVNQTKLEMIQYELREIKDFMKEVALQNIQSSPKTAFIPPALRPVYQKLIECEVEEEIAEDLIKRLQQRVTEKEFKDPHLLEELLVRQIAQTIEVAGPLAADNNKIIAFVGPTGVGKTTTIAKLAANFTLLEKKKVALITLDTYRIAAVEQLKTYAEIMGIPIDVVFTPKELIPAFKKYKDKDLILVDTAGRNPLNDLQMEELRNFIGQDGNIEVQLLISMTTKAKEIAEIFNRFEVAHIHRIIFTKLDEITSFGNLLTAVTRAKRPISYITTGQNVPEDIELADATKLAKLILTKDFNPFIKKTEVQKR